MSRETASRLATLPSLPMIGVTSTSHHLGVPLAVGQKASKWADSPRRALAIAASSFGRADSGHRVGHRPPCTALKSSISIAHWPLRFIACKLPSPSMILMQSGLCSKAQSMLMAPSVIDGALAYGGVVESMAAARFAVQYLTGNDSAK